MQFKSFLVFELRVGLLRPRLCLVRMSTKLLLSSVVLTTYTVYRSEAMRFHCNSILLDLFRCLFPLPCHYHVHYTRFRGNTAHFVP